MPVIAAAAAASGRGERKPKDIFSSFCKARLFFSIMSFDKIGMIVFVVEVDFSRQFHPIFGEGGFGPDGSDLVGIGEWKKPMWHKKFEDFGKTVKNNKFCA